MHLRNVELGPNWIKAVQSRSHGPYQPIVGQNVPTCTTGYYQGPDLAVDSYLQEPETHATNLEYFIVFIVLHFSYFNFIYSS